MTLVSPPVVHLKPCHVYGAWHTHYDFFGGTMKTATLFTLIFCLTFATTEANSQNVEPTSKLEIQTQKIAYLALNFQEKELKKYLKKSQKPQVKKPERKASFPLTFRLENIRTLHGGPGLQIY